MPFLSQKQKTDEKVNISGYWLDNSKLNKLGNIRISPLKSLAILFFVFSLILPQAAAKISDAKLYLTEFSAAKELAQAAETAAMEKREKPEERKNEPEKKAEVKLKKITLADIWPEEFGGDKNFSKVIASAGNGITEIKRSQNGKITFADIWPQEIERQAEAPRRLVIPALKVSAGIQGLGIGQSGEMDAPVSFYDAGWFELGPRPGERGNAIIAGHLNNEYGAPGIFWHLDRLKEGDDIYIIDAKGKNLHFRVSAKKIYGINSPLKEIFEGDGAIRINLITCNGVWDEKTQNYTSRLVVSAELLAQ